NPVQILKWKYQISWYSDQRNHRTGYLPGFSGMQYRPCDQEYRKYIYLLVIAVHKSQTATLLHTDSQQRVRGINADYLNLLKRALNIKLTLREYADHQKAMDALAEGE
ncbi:hypothetical protein, partial [Pseudomonas aeruginosa]|uniref:hypothetical protein n=1 Tax=Pseudomonas aeruginosa TaxID=287 RepID=UPI003C6DBDE8